MQFQLESRQVCIFVSINWINHKFMETKCPRIANSSFKRRMGGTYFVRRQKKYYKTIGIRSIWLGIWSG